MRRTYVFREVDGKYRAVPKEEACPLLNPEGRVAPGPYIVPDIKPYRSVITQEIISSRSAHKRHLREHACEEVGDQAPAWLRERQREQKEESR